MGGGGGDGGGFNGLSSIQNPFSDWKNKDGKWNLNGVLNDIVQPVRLGLWYDFKEGRIKDSSLKRVDELSGRAAARKANERAKSDLEEANRARQREADLLWLDNYRRDVQSSFQAAGMRASADARSRTAGSTRTAAGETLGGTGEEILGV